jgi:hypothetical protein
VREHRFHCALNRRFWAHSRSSDRKSRFGFHSRDALRLIWSPLAVSLVFRFQRTGRAYDRAIAGSAG